MRIRKKIDFTQLFLFFGFALAALCLFFVLDNGEPFSLLLLYGMLFAGLPILPSAVIGFFPCLFSQNITLVLIYAAQTVLLSLGFLLHNRQKRRAPLFPLLALSLSLTLFVVAAPYEAYLLPFNGDFFQNKLTQKILLAAFFFVVAAIFSVAAKALLKKFLRCRLRGDELVFIVFSLVLVGVGICHFLSVNAYLGASFLFFKFLIYSFGSLSSSPHSQYHCGCTCHCITTCIDILFGCSPIHRCHNTPSAVHLQTWGSPCDKGIGRCTERHNS